MTIDRDKIHEQDLILKADIAAKVGLPACLALVAMDRAAKAQIVSFAVDSESKLVVDQPGYPVGIRQLSDYLRSTDSTKNAILTFEADFRSRFRKSRQVAVTTTEQKCSTTRDSKGRTSTQCHPETHTRYETVYYWDIPPEIVGVIGTEDSNFLYRANLSLPNRPLPSSEELVHTFSANEPRSIYLKAQDDDPTTRTIIAGVSAGSVGGLYSLYDEFAKRLVEDWSPALSKNIGRRAFLKTIFLPVGAHIASLVDDGSVKNNQNLATELKDKISTTIGSVQARTKDQISADIFGVGVATTYQQLKALRNILNNLAIVAQTSRSNAVTGISTPALSLRGVVDQTITYIENNLPKSNDIPNLPPEALDTASSIVLTRELNNYTQAANRSSVLYPLVSAAASLGIFAAGAAGIEGVLKLTTRNKKD